MDVSPMVFFSYENFNTAIDTKKEGKYMFLFGKKKKKSTQTAQNTQVKRAAHEQAAQAVTETEEEKAARKQAEKEADAGSSKGNDFQKCRFQKDFQINQKIQRCKGSKISLTRPHTCIS